MSDSKNIGCATSGCLIFVVLAASLMFIGERKDENQPHQSHGDEPSAKLMVERFVSEYLKFPDEAEYPRSEKSAVFNRTDSTWVVKGMVKTKNAFGVTSRHLYVVELGVTEPGGDTWRAYIVKIDGQFFVDQE